MLNFLLDYYYYFYYHKDNVPLEKIRKLTKIVPIILSPIYKLLILKIFLLTISFYRLRNCYFQKWTDLLMMTQITQNYQD